MKNQYAGDVGDYTKLGILRGLEKAGFSIGLNWYLTPDEPEHSKTFTDGKHTKFLECDCDTPDIDLHCALQKIGLSKNRRAIDDFLATEWCRYLKKYFL